MLNLLLDLEIMLGLPDGLVPEGALIGRFGNAAVAAARSSGLIRVVFFPSLSGAAPATPPIGLTSRGRLIASASANGIFPLELAAEPHEIVSAVLHGARAGQRG